MRYLEKRCSAESVPLKLSGQVMKILGKRLVLTKSQKFNLLILLFNCFKVF